MKPLPPKRYVAWWRAWRDSLIGRMGAAMMLVGVLAVVSGVALLQFVDASVGKAAAINVAGSLRMRSYGIGLAMLDRSGDEQARRARLAEAIAAFEQRLHAPALAGQIPPAADAPLREAYWRLVSHWTRLKRQLAALPLEGTGASPSAGAGALAGPGAVTGAGTPPGAALGPEEALAAIREFVDEANVLVAMLQADLESRIEHYKMVGSATLLLVLGVLASSLLYARSNLARPLADLQRCSRAIRAGDFDARVGAAPVSEFDDLAAAFNGMASDLSAMYGELEARVQVKTAELERSNRSLALLYEVARELSQPAPTRGEMAGALRRLAQVLGVESASLCTGHDAPVPCVELAVTGSGCGLGGTARAQCAGCRSAAAGALASFDLVDGGTLHGTLALRLAPGQRLAPWQQELADAVARQFAAALSNVSRVQSQQRLALLEERGAIARELHDSLAQALSYLKIQVARLRSALAPTAAAQDATVSGVIDELKGGLDAAYRQLRELLTTFRLGMDGRGLASALRDAADEFARRGGLRIDLDHRLADLELTANQQIHVLHTVREALANVERHARARNACVRLTRDAHDMVTVTIDDDGVGIGDAASRPNHYGLAIMRDRAASLGGRCAIASRPEGGTRVELRFHAGGDLPELAAGNEAHRPAHASPASTTITSGPLAAASPAVPLVFSVSPPA